MNHRHRPARLVAAGLVAAGAALGAVGAPAHAEPAGPDVPTAVAVPAGHKVFLVGHAVGVQIYSCNGERWSFVAPRADLYGDNGNLVTTHFGGPTWQAKDGSSVRARRDGDYTPDPTAIPWLRLAATSTAAGSGRRSPRRHHLHPADGNDRWARAGRRRVQRHDRRDDAGGPVHRRLPLLEGDRSLTCDTLPSTDESSGASSSTPLVNDEQTIRAAHRALGAGRARRRPRHRAGGSRRRTS